MYNKIKVESFSLDHSESLEKQFFDIVIKYRQNTNERKSLEWNNNNVPTNAATKKMKASEKKSTNSE